MFKMLRLAADFDGAVSQLPPDSVYGGEFRKKQSPGQQTDTIPWRPSGLGSGETSS
jgi:hypothetical protein